MLRFLAFFPGLEAQPSAATPQALRASSPSRGAKNRCVPAATGMATHRQLKLRFTAHLAGEPRKWLQTIRRRSQGKSTANQKPPLPGEVARRSRDGGVSGLCYVAIPGFFPRLQGQPIEATPQALRAGSTRKGMATHLAGEPLSRSVVFIRYGPRLRVRWCGWR